MTSKVVPRPDQIDALTRGLAIPLPPLQHEHLMVISEVLALAWSQLLSSHRATLLSGEEAEVNALMETHLCALLDVHPLWAQLVRNVTRGKETVSFDGSSLEKRPDLSIHLTSRNPSFPIVVECKLIDAKNGKGHDIYCAHGLARFLSGEYAWATREAFMLAYVRDGSTIASVLSPYLARGKSCEARPYAVRQLPTSVALDTLDLARSGHDRGFRYINRQAPNDQPGELSVWHLWLKH